MCQFCKEHGEGKKWYLEMKNYSRELLHEDLSAETRKMTEVETRGEWVDRFLRSFVIPAMTGKSDSPKAGEGEAGAQAVSKEPAPTEAEILARRQIVHFGQVIPIEDVEQVIDRADSVTRIPCGCRFISTGKADKRYCFGLGIDRAKVLGAFPEAGASLEVLDGEGAKKILRDYDEEGLVHSVWTGITPYIVGVCNCDRDCLAYKGYIEKRGVPTFFRAEYVGQVDWEACNGCKSCMSQCQFGAEFYSSALGKVYIDPTRCFGCGVCRATCPNDAISLVPREEHPEAAGIWLGAAGK